MEQSGHDQTGDRRQEPGPRSSPVYTSHLPSHCLWLINLVNYLTSHTEQENIEIFDIVSWAGLAAVWPGMVSCVWCLVVVVVESSGEVVRCDGSRWSSSTGQVCQHHGRTREGVVPPPPPPTLAATATAGNHQPRWVWQHTSTYSSSSSQCCTAVRCYNNVVLRTQSFYTVHISSYPARYGTLPSLSWIIFNSSILYKQRNIDKLKIGIFKLYNLFLTIGNWNIW